MKITGETKLKDILNEYPWLLDEAIKIDEKFKILKNPVGKMFIKNATISGLSEKAGLSTDGIIGKIEEMIASHNA